MPTLHWIERHGGEPPPRGALPSIEHKYGFAAPSTNLGQASEQSEPQRNKNHYGDNLEALKALPEYEGK